MVPPMKLEIRNPPDESRSMIETAGSQVVAIARRNALCGLMLVFVACGKSGDDGKTKGGNDSGGAYVALDSGDVHSCALRRDGIAVCWGAEGDVRS